MGLLEKIDDVVESIADYRLGGYHPVHLHDLFNERYEITGKLAHGQTSTVWLAWDQRLEQQVALKIVKADASRDNKELEILLYLSNPDLDHPGKRHVIKLLDHFEHRGPNGIHLCLIFPVLVSDGKEMVLAGKPRQYSSRAQGIFDETDPSMLLVQLGDLGGAAWSGQCPERPVTLIPLRAPELVHRSEWDFKIDIWTLGCLLFELATNEPLFSVPCLGLTAEQIDQEHKILIDQIIGESSQMLESFAFFLLERLRANPQVTRRPHNLVSFLCSMLQRDPRARKSAAELLKDPWMMGEKFW
ncbi:uncharacterized protein ATNIH1004_009042 [Aspergillus tanneri]|uniref:non-specific serine/threonine protein kinase n=1 Tax=Aspergillus tanneri TaxID=1220188 RepID=A0A5M9MHN4_9EURO|nr:uncharacterized protein ATNIH1004_009042 [Aspergillus tanneri]KAA8644834.1 hypothetical protein ATNIH1004_009042 [Aspergillus tanneri]